MLEVENREEGVVVFVCVRIVFLKERLKWVLIEYLVEFNGEIWDYILISCVFGKEMEEYVVVVGCGENVLLFMVWCLIEVWDVMDVDDQVIVDEVVLDFMFCCLKVVVELICLNGVFLLGK